MVWFTFECVEDNMTMLVVCCAVMGWFMTGILPIAMDTSVEVTFPLAPATISNLLLMSAQIFGIILIIAMTYLLRLGIAPANWSLVAILLVASVLMFFFFPKYRRLDMEQSSKSINS